MWTPRLLWIPEHCMHMKMPKFTLAHLGPLPKCTAKDSSLPALAYWNQKSAWLSPHWKFQVTYLALQSAHSLFSGNLRRPSRIYTFYKNQKHRWDRISHNDKCSAIRSARTFLEKLLISADRATTQLPNAKAPLSQCIHQVAWRMQIIIWILYS